MSEAEAGRVLVDCCGACGGTWYDRGELEQAIAAEKAQAQSLWDHLPGPDPRRDAKIAYRNCPLCRQAMHRKRRGPVIIDLCGPHGAFLDAGELEQIAQHREEVVESKQEKQVVSRAPAIVDDSFAEAATGAIAIELAAEVIAAVFFDW